MTREYAKAVLDDVKSSMEVNEDLWQFRKDDCYAEDEPNAFVRVPRAGALYTEQCFGRQA